MKIELVAHCGCGARFTDLNEAVEHATQKVHSLTLQGSIDPHTREEKEIKV